jgi:acetyl-CoA carboxylase biotin carboxylase subunit
VVEEAPSPALNAAERTRLGEIGVRAMARLGYRSLGTIEFLYQDGQFYFIEMNTRLQVEHPVTEMITGVDLVREQIRVATGAPLGYGQDAIAFHGHAIECRINAEHPRSFAPAPGRVSEYHAPGGLVVHGRSRNECLMRLKRSLAEYVIGGIETTIPLHREIIAAPAFIDGAIDIHWLERFVAGGG